jgi:hypothetical protein
MGEDGWAIVSDVFVEYMRFYSSNCEGGRPSLEQLAIAD